MSLTQTVGSSSCVLPEWRPEVLNRFLSCYSFCRHVEKLSSGITFSISFTVPSLFHSCRILTEARYLCQAPPLWLVLFFSGAERYPVVELRVHLHSQASGVAHEMALLVYLHRQIKAHLTTYYLQFYGILLKMVAVCYRFCNKEAADMQKHGHCPCEKKYYVWLSHHSYSNSKTKQRQGFALVTALKMDYLNSSLIVPVKCWEHTYILLVNCVAWGIQQMHRLSSIYIIKEHGNMKNKCHYLCLRFFF